MPESEIIEHIMLEPMSKKALFSLEDMNQTTRMASLTPQQFRVLEMVADGQLNKQIAWELDIQERTVKAHMSEIFQKLGVRNRTQAGVTFRQLALPSSQGD
jgi:DNA-binding NarL/FixJ family response regulator